jgi:hypothetical protein
MAACAVAILGEDELRRDLRADTNAQRTTIGKSAAFGWIDCGGSSALPDLDAFLDEGGRVRDRVDQQLCVRVQRAL